MIFEFYETVCEGGRVNNNNKNNNNKNNNNNTSNNNNIKLGGLKNFGVEEVGDDWRSGSLKNGEGVDKWLIWTCCFHSTFLNFYYFVPVFNFRSIDNKILFSEY